MPLPDILLSEENKTGGILIVVQPGYGPKEHQSARRSFFSDRQLDHGDTLNQFIDWFDLWSIPLERSRGQDTAFERSFFTLEWPKEKIKEGHGPQLVPKFASFAHELSEVIEKRKPRLVIFLSCYLWQAMNLAKDAFTQSAGNPLDNGRRITSERLAAYIQPWERLTVLALPQPSKNTTAKYVRTLSSGVQEALRRSRALPTDTRDPYLESARDCLIFDREASVFSIQTQLHLSRDRAQKLFDDLKDQTYFINRSGRPQIKN